MKKVILCVANDLTIDQRLHKVCTTLLKNGYDPLLVGFQKKNSLPLTKRDYKCLRLPLFFISGKLFYAEVNIRLFFYLLFSKADLINSNDLDTILPCYLVAKIKKSKLVYDSHEYFTELPELQNRKLTKFIWTSIEKFVLPRLQIMSTVGTFIAKEYHQKYKLLVLVIRNMPFKTGKQGNVEKPKNILIYQGAVNMGRGIELMMGAMSYLPDFELWIVGEGLIFKKVKEESSAIQNIVVFGKKNFDELAPLTNQASLGLSLEEDLGLNYRYSLPNKIFDYVNARIPVIVSDLPEMRNLVEEHQIGKILFDRSPKGLSELILSVWNDQNLYNNLVENCENASKILNWEMQEPILLSMYQPV